MLPYSLEFPIAQKTVLMVLCLLHSEDWTRMGFSLYRNPHMVPDKARDFSKLPELRAPLLQLSERDNRDPSLPAMGTN